MGWNSADPAFAAKTDVLKLRNGDHITGEVKSLDRGRLSFSTDDVGTISVEWNKVSSLTATRTFDVELESGRHLYGPLLAPPSVGLLRIADFGDTVVVGILSVVRIDPIEASVWKNLKATVDLGFNLAKAHHYSQLSADFSLRYRTLKHSVYFAGNSLLIQQDEVDDTQRGSLTLNYSRILAARWFAQLGAGAERSSELGLDLRLSTSAIGGRYLIQSNTALLGAGLGLSANVENPEQGDSQWNGEWVGGIAASYFLYDSPKTSFDLNLNGFRNMGEKRYRAEMDLSAKREVITDLTMGLSAIESYDSKPPGGVSKNDWTLMLTIGWTH